MSEYQDRERLHAFVATVRCELEARDDPTVTVTDMEIATVLEIAKQHISGAAWDEGWTAHGVWVDEYDEWEDNYDESRVTDDSLEGHRDDNPPAPKKPANPYRADVDPGKGGAS